MPSPQLSARLYYSKATPHFSRRGRRQCQYLSAIYSYLIKTLRLPYLVRSIIISLYVLSPSLVSIIGLVLTENRPKAAGYTVGGNCAMVGWYLLWSTGVVVEGQEERLVDITRKWFERSLLAKKPLVAQRRIGGCLAWFVVCSVGYTPTISLV